MEQVYYTKSSLSRLVLAFFLTLMLNSCNIFAPGPSKGPKRQQRPVAAASDAKKIIFILNGVWQKPETFNNTVQSLLANFRAKGLAVEVRVLMETATSIKSIDQQARDAFEELKQQLADNKYEVILIGHSQGGLRGARILSLNKEEGSPLDIRGLITLGTPWEGAPGATITKHKIQSLLERKPVIYGLKAVDYVPHLDKISKTFTTGTIGNLFDYYFPTHEPGVQDMIPNSRFLESVAASLANNDIPILAVAGVNTEAKSFLYNADNVTYMQYIQKVPPVVFNRFYARILAGGWYVKHDMLVPLDSQLAKNISKSNIFETYTVQGAIHDILPGLLIPSDKVIYNHTEVIQGIVEFTKRNCGFGIL